MHIAVVDDEAIVCEQIKTLIQKALPDQDSEIALYTSGRSLLKEGRHFDLVYLDIQMEGIDGMETARAFRKAQHDALLIFVTGAKEYALEAFDVSAFHYLLKPLEEVKFTQVLEEAQREVKRRRSSRQERLFLRAKNKTIAQGDIVYIESRGKKVDIHTLKETFTIYGSMNELEAQLGESFYRCHRGYLVNMAFITQYGPDSIMLTGGAAVYLTKKKHGEFVKTYMWYLQNGGVSSV